MEQYNNHKAGFVNIIGSPNVGKSTLSNALMGEKISITTSKPQTTRHRILGILSGEDYQIIFSDSPGIISDPKYTMQNAMNKFAFSSFDDADVLVYVTDIFEPTDILESIQENIKKISIPKILIINKSDLDKDNKAPEVAQYWENFDLFDAIIILSALQQTNIDSLKELIISHLPESPAFYPKDQLSDKNERFFASEIIRENILMLYQKEVPYSCEVIVHRFKEEKTKDDIDMLKIYADIIVNRKSQKPIIIGKNGEKIKNLGIKSREGLERFFGIKVFLDLNVKIKPNWRDDEKTLKHFGYIQ